MLPVDTMTGDLLQAPLEWLGYEADYLDIGEKALPEDVGQRYAAVFLDGEMSVPLAKEKPLVEWLLRPCIFSRMGWHVAGALCGVSWVFKQQPLLWGSLRDPR